MRLRWSHRAQRDLDAIFDYIAADNPTAALGGGGRRGRELSDRAESVRRVGEGQPSNFSTTMSMNSAARKSR